MNLGYLSNVSGKQLAGLAVLTAVMLAGAEGEEASGSFAMLVGAYEVVSLRKSGLVAAPADFASPTEGNLLGQTVIITEEGIELEGISCQDWQISAGLTDTHFNSEPVISDLRLPPLMSPRSQSDRRIGLVFDVDCEGERFASIYQADRRVIAMTWQNSSAYLILEKPLSDADARRFTRQLADMKFLDDAGAEPMGETMLAAAREYFTYRTANVDDPVPLRPAFTENFLDGIILRD